MQANEIILIDNQLFDDKTTDQIIEERNKEIKSLEQDIIALNDSMIILATLLNEQGDELKIAEMNVEQSEITMIETVAILENIPDKKDTVINTVKVISGIVIGGTIVGSIGSIFGILPAIIGVGLGSGTGGIVAYISNLLKK